MPKVILEFDLPKEKEEFELVNHARDYFLALLSIDKYLKDECAGWDGSVRDMEGVRARICNILADNNIKLYE